MNSMNLPKIDAINVNIKILPTMWADSSECPALVHVTSNNILSPETRFDLMETAVLTFFRGIIEEAESAGEEVSIKDCVKVFSAQLMEKAEKERNDQSVIM